MTIRPIEMQIALQNSQNIGKIQEQIQQRGQVAHEYLLDEQKEKAENERTAVTKSDETAQSKLERDKEEKRRQQDKENKKGKTEKNVVQKEPHPYKGKFVDFSG